ncbi:MAG TPA: D-2-hydroxyacid dehydrogenase [Planctomycetaceae bacterium]|nr:D-2-hydroxyacid dehydrogenase [Planctomycetaceae bacterium]
MKLVLFPTVDDRRLELIREAARPMSVVNARDEAQALEEIADADAFFGKITPPLLARAKQLRWVQTATASLEHYMFDALVEHPCRLSNMRGLYSDVIADHVMGFVLSFARNLHLYRDQQRARQWEPIGGEAGRADFAAGPAYVSEIDRRHLHLSDCTLGVVGVGNIGAEICRRAQSFGMRILGIDPVRREVADVVPQVWPPERLFDLLQESDFVVIAAPHTPETYKLFRHDKFEAMKPTAYLINIGRGAIVDLADLVAALESGRIAGAALDVFEVEPLPADSALWTMPNVLITPHIAAASTHIAARHTQTLLENIRLFVAGEDPTTLVDKSKWF